MDLDLSPNFNIPEFLLGDLGKALSKFCAIPLETFNERLERPRKLIEGRTTAMIEFEKTASSEVAKISVQNPDIFAQALNTFGASLIKKQMNRNAVALETVNLLEGTEANPNLKREPLDEDWLDYLAMEAEKFSNVDKQRWFAKILAGEIKKPGTFSMRAVRVMASLSQKEAEIFQKYAQQLWLGDILGDALDDKKLFNSDFLLLEDCGVVANARSNACRHQILVDGFLFIHTSKYVFKAELKPDLKSTRLYKEKQEYRVPIVALTRAGQEIARVLSPEEPVEFGKHILQTLGADFTSLKYRSLLGKEEWIEVEPCS